MLSLLFPESKTVCKKPPRNSIHTISSQNHSIDRAICDTGMGANSAKRREAATMASIWVLVTKGYGPHCHKEEVNKFLPKAWWFHCNEAIAEATGGREELLRRMANGGVIPTGKLGAWSPDLWAGLHLGGAFFRLRISDWRTAPLAKRPALASALMGAKSFHGRIEEWYSSFGRCLRLTELWVARLGADEPGGVGVFRGILCSARLVKHNGMTWAGVPKRDGIIEVAEGLGVPYFIVAKEGSVKTILFSPFWGILLSPDMPIEIAEWYRGNTFRKPGMCPLLPWVFLRGAWGYKLSNRVAFPVGIVPNLVSRERLWKAGWKVSGMMEAGLRELGMTRVDNRMRAAWLRWMEWKGISSGDFREGKVPAGLIEPLGKPQATVANSDVATE
jgi:hypothetical protein